MIATGLSVAAALGLDLWSKQWAWDTLHISRERITVVDKFFYFDFSFNTGAAFGFLEGTVYARPLFIVITVLTVLYMLNMVRTLPTRRLYGFIAIGLIIGGALGNLHDRFVRTLVLGGEEVYGVVDFILVYYLPGKRWPTFNVADIALVLGVGLLFPYLLLHAQPEAQDEGDGAAASEPPVPEPGSEA
jgi:signal peptidase II